MDIPQEDSCGALAIPKDWPSQGQIEFQNVVLRYLPSLPPALCNISFTITGGSQVNMSFLLTFGWRLRAYCPYS